PTAAPPIGPFALQGRNAGTSVVILGAGLAGLTCAYELGRVGYQCQILEARARPGGRCWTVRHGSAEAELDGALQPCQFDDGQYFNPGPARIPQEHGALLTYCRAFGVALEGFTNSNRAAYYHSAGDATRGDRLLPQGAALTDMHGYTAELLAKAVRQEQLDAPLTAADAERLVDYLRSVGDLSAGLAYVGSSRGGARAVPFGLDVLLRSDFWQFAAAAWDAQQQSTLLQPVGGMDRIAQAFVARLGPRIRYGAEVRAIRRAPDGVRVVVATANGRMEELRADVCVCTIPLPVLATIPVDVTPAMQAAIRRVPYASTIKIGLQFARRFWEEDDGIYGGISWTDQPIAQIWYPSWGYGARKGVVQGAYTFGAAADALGALSPQARLAEALTQGARLHAQYRDTYETGFSVAWQRVRYSQGGWAQHGASTEALQAVDGVIYLAGEHMSELTGWQEGAVRSAQHVVQQIHERYCQREPNRNR
ncbi:MAG: flavin monoamine oxidase family protein, partial [Chloroflexales bacterium]|nr:flavin monoamine oxidase family protein [Chloroflexales bacterium]